jgi:NTP pyrophosphatase (non-canonical NTP hydrolase)
MNLDDYQREVEVFAREPAPVVRGTPAWERRLGEYALGLGGEMSEVMAELSSATGTRPALVYELGDVCWYIAALCTTLNVSLEELGRYDPRGGSTSAVAVVEAASHAIINAGRVQEYVKKHLFHGAGLPDEKVMMVLSVVFQQIERLAYCLGVAIEDVFELNITKLRERRGQAPQGEPHAASVSG